MEATRAGTPPAPDRTTALAPFRAWGGSRLVVAEEPTRVTIEPLDRIPPDRSTSVVYGGRASSPDRPTS